MWQIGAPPFKHVDAIRRIDMNKLKPLHNLPFTLTTLLLLMGIPLVQASNFVRPGGAAEIEEVAAGYVALFTCSAHFVMGRKLDDILAEELVDLKSMELPPPNIDAQRFLVTAQDHSGRTAVAAYRPSLGCSVLPPDWQTGDVARLPSISLPDTPDLADTPFPDGDQARPRPNRAQRDLLESALDGNSFGEGTHTVGVIVIKDGNMVAERYRPGFGIHTGYRTWSTAKSITATLIGIAQRDGLLQVDDPANIPEWQYFDDPRQAITIRHLLQMSSGLQSYGANTNAIYFGGQDAISAATGMPLEGEPGAVWKYANNDTLLLLRSLRATLDDDLRYLRYPYDELFRRIGMYHTRMETDHQGNFIGSSQVYTTARDLARFGLLYLNDGMWSGQRILPEGWSSFVAESAPALPREDGKQGYGAQFWLLDRLAGVPPGTYTTAGNKGQFVTIVPTHSMVIVRTGIDPNGKRWDQGKFVAEAVTLF